MNISVLKTITDVFLNEEADYRQIRNASEELFDYFNSITCFEVDSSKISQHINTPSGKAIAPAMATMCIRDMMRTCKFLRGINQAIIDQLEKNPGKPVTILYAGTGPYAALLSPLTTRFSPAELKMFLIEIHPQSIFYLDKLIDALDLRGYVIQIVEADAASFVIPGNFKPDIILSETMNRALEKEPQLAILLNLVNQFETGVVVIPEAISVSLSISDNNLFGIPRIQELATLLKLDANSARLIRNDPSGVPFLRDGMLIEIQKREDISLKHLILQTTVHVYRQHVLGYNECALTLPVNLISVDNEKNDPLKMEFYYRAGTEPRFTYELK